MGGVIRRILAFVTEVFVVKLELSQKSARGAQPAETFSTVYPISFFANILYIIFLNLSKYRDKYVYHLL
jgi:hypothetical protein